MSQQSSRVLKISIEGNIATGKSTFIDLLQEINSTSWHVVPEPVAEWTKIPDNDKVLESTSNPKSPVKHAIRSSPIKSPMKQGNKTDYLNSSPIRERDVNPNIPSTLNDALTDTPNEGAADEEISCQSAANLLELFYSDTPRWAYTFQSYALLSRMRLQKRPPPRKIRNAKDPVLFYERSLYTDRYIFAKNCWETNLMTDLEWDIYSDWSDYLLNTQGDIHIHGVIYLRATPEVSHERLQKRSRTEETGVTLEYLKQLHAKHENWLHYKNVTKHESLYDVPILELDCNQEFETDESYRTNLFNKVKDFIAECVTDQNNRKIALMGKENMQPKKQRLSFDTLKEVSPIKKSKTCKNLEPVFGPGGDKIIDTISDEPTIVGKKN